MRRWRISEGRRRWVEGKGGREEAGYINTNGKRREEETS